MEKYHSWKPEDIWLKIRSGEIDGPTAGMCGGYAQANLVILPKRYADDFKEFAKKNPKPCPILEIVEGGPAIHAMGEGATLLTDLPRYRIYRNGVFEEEVTDISSYWQEDFVGFLIGCSFSFEEALLKVVNLGQDTDTTGAIAGGLAALYYGYDAIPAEWIGEIKKKEWIAELCDQAEEIVK